MTVTAAFPHRFQTEPTVRITRAQVSTRLAGPSIYDAVDYFEHTLYRHLPRRTRRITDRIPLKTILNLHNADGLQWPHQIDRMLRQIRAGGNVLQSSGLPNVKLVTTRKGERVLFDGHHSILAYLAAGRRYLDEIPHLIVHDGSGRVTDRAILVFFGQHARRLTPATWRETTLNWQALPSEQLNRRIETTIGGLSKAFTR